MTTTATIRVATYNVHGCRGRDGVRSPDRIGRVVGALDVDVIGLQEVFSDPETPDVGDQLAHLAAVTGMTAIPAPTNPPHASGYGNAVLTRLEVVDVAHRSLSVGRREPRGAVEVVVRWRETSVAVVVTHLGLGRRERAQQVRALLDWCRRRPRVPRVVVGDLNEWNRWSAAWRLLSGAFHGTGAVATFPARRPLFPLDRILVVPPARVVGVALQRDRLTGVASDHLPLVASIDPGGPRS